MYEGDDDDLRTLRLCKSSHDRSYTTIGLETERRISMHVVDSSSTSKQEVFLGRMLVHLSLRSTPCQKERSTEDFLHCWPDASQSRGRDGLLWSTLDMVRLGRVKRRMTLICRCLGFQNISNLVSENDAHKNKSRRMRGPLSVSLPSQKQSLKPEPPLRIIILRLGG